MRPAQLKGGASGFKFEGFAKVTMDVKCSRASILRSSFVKFSSSSGAMGCSPHSACKLFQPIIASMNEDRIWGSGKPAGAPLRCDGSTHRMCCQLTIRSRWSGVEILRRSD